MRGSGGGHCCGCRRWLDGRGFFRHGGRGERDGGFDAHLIEPPEIGRVHGVDPVREGGINLFHPLGKQVVILPESLAFAFICLGLVGLFQKRAQRLLLVGLDLHRIIAGLLLLALLLRVSAGIDGGGLLRLLGWGCQGIGIAGRWILAWRSQSGIRSRSRWFVRRRCRARNKGVVAVQRRICCRRGIAIAWRHQGIHIRIRIGRCRYDRRRSRLGGCCRGLGRCSWSRSCSWNGSGWWYGIFLKLQGSRCGIACRGKICLGDKLERCKGTQATPNKEGAGEGSDFCHG